MTNSSKPLPTIGNLFSRFISIILLIVFLIIACKFLVSSILIIKPEYTISRGEDGKQKLESTEALQILERLQRAENQSILGVHLVDELKINELYCRLYLTLAKAKKPNTNLKLAKHYATRLIESAPSHYLGYTLLTQSIIDPKTDLVDGQIALNKSLTFGRFEIKNQIRLLPIIIRHWAKLTQENKELAYPMLHQVLNDTHTDYIAAKYMRKFNNIAPFEKLIKNSKNEDRIRQMLKK